MNIRLLAVQAGDALKYDTSVNEIERVGSAIFPFRREQFPEDSITSVRAKRIYDWLMSLGKHPCSEDERNNLLSKFLFNLARSEDMKSELAAIMEAAGVRGVSPDGDVLRRFDAREFHASVVQHCRRLFGQKHFFHAVFEAAKVYNKSVREKSESTKDGAALMLEVWGADGGVLKVTPCVTETDKNVQDGIKFLSAGFMRAIRNPTSHEPALDWPITERDAVDILSFVSFLFRQLDKAVKFP